MLDETGIKWLEVRELQNSLAQLPNNCKLCVNKVGNLLIHRKDQYFGYVDFMDGSVEKENGDE